MKKKIGRNDPCPCGSGKKFKKCCERTMIGKKYTAHKIESSDQISSKVSGLSSLIQAPPQESERKIDVTSHQKKQAEEKPSDSENS